VGLFLLLVLSTALTVRFGFGRETEMLVEMGVASAVFASFFLSAFTSELLMAREKRVEPLYFTRPGLRWWRDTAAAAATAAVALTGFFIVATALLSAVLIRLESWAAAVAALACAFGLVAVLRRSLGRGCTEPAAWLAPCALVLASLGVWAYALASKGNIPSYLHSGLIFGAVEVIYISIMCIFAQAFLPGIGGIVASSLAFAAGNMKGFLIASGLPEVLQRMLEIAFAPLPNLQALTVAGRSGPGFSWMLFADVLLVLFVFSAGALAVTTWIRTGGQVR
jgi:hypothetical protein